MIEHTKTPYKVTDCTVSYGFSIRISDEADTVIARVNNYYWGGGKLEVDKANARFIVQACNRDHHFEEMREELHNALLSIREGRYMHMRDSIEALLTKLDKGE